MAECATAKDDAKAAFWAEQVLKSLSLAKKPPDASEADWNKTVKTVQKTSYEVIGANQVREKKWAEAIQTNKRLLQLEVYDVPLFNIAWAEWQTGDLDNAKLHFAMAEYCGGALKAKSTEYFEQLYKSQQNNTLIGVERYRKRAQAEVEALKVKK
jgi:hypothetical protein